MTNPKRLFISFSGGRTSAFMAWWLTHQAREHWDEVVTVFANTGAEHPKTYRFVQDCNDAWGLNVVWVEAVVHHDERTKCTHRIVDYQTACMNIQDPAPFEEVIEKYGISNKSWPHCTRELKENAMESYIQKELGWIAGEYDTAIGLRHDEMLRVNPRYRERRIIYPLVGWDSWPSIPMCKPDILRWWAAQPFDLGLSEREGNCVFCWKKSPRKLFQLIREHPEWFDFTKRMEATRGRAGAQPPGCKPRVFFRENRSTLDMFKIVADNVQLDLFDLDSANGCEESCEIYSAESEEMDS